MMVYQPWGVPVDWADVDLAQPWWYVPDEPPGVDIEFGGWPEGWQEVGFVDEH